MSEEITFDAEPDKIPVHISIREFALPCPRVGSIDSNSGYGRSMDAAEQGIEIHQRIQRNRKNEFENYHSEVKTTHSFVRGKFEFKIEGRIDGIFDPIDGSRPIIEEIKSCFTVHELFRILSEETWTHPYSLQLLTYGYFYYQEHGVIPELSFYLVSSRNSETRDLTVRFKLEEYEKWLDLRLNELVVEAENAEVRMKRRKKMAIDFPFPFEKPRSGQRELIATIEEGMAAEQPMLIQAPTGLGKTAGVLYPSLKNSLARGQRVIYVTPKNSQHTVAEETVERFQEKDLPLKSLTLTAKTKLCMKAEPLCNPQYCEYAKDYYTKVAENDLKGELAGKKKLTSRVFKNMAEKYEVCPFELQLEATHEADVVICDYNYVFSARSALKRVSHFEFAEEGKPNLVIDEAHNLPSRAMGYYSPALSGYTLEKMKEEFQELPKKFASDGLMLLNECLQIIKDCNVSGGVQPIKINPPVEAFLEQDLKLRSYLSSYLESDVEIEPQDPVLRLSFYWSEFTSILEQISQTERDEFFITYQPPPIHLNATKVGTIKITCCDASEMLEETYEDFEQVVGFSATLKPFDYYSRLSGLKNLPLKTAEFSSPFEKSKRKVLIIPQISTKFSEREKNYGRISEAIQRIVQIHPGNHLAFFPSFDFMEKVIARFVTPPGFLVMKQERNMLQSQVNETLEFLKGETTPTILFAVQGGVFSEGVDYPGNMVIGAFVIGPPLPSFDLERETMKKYYEEHYQEGFDYAYAYPAMAKAVQAAGRVIRSENDRGIIVLMDNRFLHPSYVKSMPSDWFSNSPQELVSTKILQDVTEFWNQT